MVFRVFTDIAAVYYNIGVFETVIVIIKHLPIHIIHALILGILSICRSAAEKYMICINVYAHKILRSDKKSVGDSNSCENWNRRRITKLYAGNSETGARFRRNRCIIIIIIPSRCCTMMQIRCRPGRDSASWCWLKKKVW